MDVAGRIPRLLERMAADGVEAVVITSATNIRYLTGFSGSNAILIVCVSGPVSSPVSSPVSRTVGDATLVTDGRYTEQAPAELEAAGVMAAIDITPDLFGATARLVKAASRLTFEADHLSVAEHTRLTAAVRMPLEASSRLVEDLRARKDDGEIARIEAAAEIADAALGATQALLLERPTEQQFGFELDTAMRRFGASERSFETIVASGPNGALPHARPTDRIIEAGDLVVLDFGALVDGYHSDMTRTKMVGTPTPQQQEMLDLVTASQAAGREAVKPGIEAKAIDDACRTIIANAGYGDAFMHGTGHGVGLDIHEFPAVSSRSDTMLQTGHVITVEPGVYLPDIGGVRVEDTVVVTDDGYRALTKSSKSSEPSKASFVPAFDPAELKDKN